MNIRNPIQPLVKGEHGVLRFKANKIVCHLLDHGGIDMNAIARMDFTDDDRQQFAQLIGYSLSGYGELRSYVSDYAYAAAETMAEEGLSDKDARIACLEEALSTLRDSLRGPMASLFGKHPEDLMTPD